MATVTGFTAARAMLIEEHALAALAAALAAQGDANHAVSVVGSVSVDLQAAQAAVDAAMIEVATAKADVATALLEVATAQADVETAQAAVDAVGVELSELTTVVTAADATATAAQATAEAAQTTATDAQTASVTAAEDALEAVGLAGTKAVVKYQTTAPTGLDAGPLTLWIDTTAGANTPKKWVSGTTWASVTDKVATDAADAAVAADDKASTAIADAATAQSAAVDAQSDALAAGIAAGAAQTAADNAQDAADAAALVAAAAQTQADTATTTANGKNSITWSVNNPSGTGVDGDTWFKRDATTGVVIGQWEWVSGAWAVRTLASVVIAALDAGKITTGYLDAARIKAGSITADRVVVGAAGNLIPNGSGEWGALGGWSNTTLMSFDAADAPSGLPGSFKSAASQGTQLQNGSFFPVIGGQEYLFEVWLKADKPNSVLYMELRDQAGVSSVPTSTAIPGQAYAGASPYLVNALTLPTVWTKYSKTILVGATATSVRIGSIFFNHSTGTERTAVQAIAGMRLIPRATAVTIADGAIVAGKIAIGSITATDGVIESLDAAKISTGYLLAARIATDTIVAAHIKAGNITAGKLATDSVVAANIKAGEVVAGKLAANSVVATNIAANAITAEKISATAITGKTITGGTITGSDFQTASDNSSRIIMGSAAYTAGRPAIVWDLDGTGVDWTDPHILADITGDFQIIGPKTSPTTNGRASIYMNKATNPYIHLSATPASGINGGRLLVDSITNAVSVNRIKIGSSEAHGASMIVRSRNSTQAINAGTWTDVQWTTDKAAFTDDGSLIGSAAYFTLPAGLWNCTAVVSMNGGTAFHVRVMQVTSQVHMTGTCVAPLQTGTASGQFYVNGTASLVVQIFNATAGSVYADSATTPTRVTFARAL